MSKGKCPYRFVACKKYGEDGVIPDEKKYHGKPEECCISSSGGSICCGYRGHYTKQTDEGPIIITKCAENMEACYEHRK